jgi:putative membrane protein
MSRSVTVAVLLIAALSSTSVFAQSTASSYPSSPDQIQPATVADPQEFATKAAGAGDFEIQSSKLALTMSQNADIKSFAQMMIDDHTKAADALKAAAASQGNITLPSAPDADTTAKLQKLQAASGADFDKLYVQMQIDAHVDAVALFSGYSQNGAAGPLKDFAGQTLPTLKMHYQHALALPH